MSLQRPLFSRIPWVRLEHIVVVKVGLSLGLLAAYFVPAPYSIAVGAAANMVWLWKL